MMIRASRAGDAPAVARVHVRSWQAAYRGLMPDEYLDGLRAEDRAARYDLDNRDPQRPCTMVATDDERIVGFASIMAARDADLSGYGELAALYVEPDRWGTGIGAILIAHARNRLVELGFKDAALWVLAGNARADRFYKKDGWAADGQRRTETVWGLHVEEFRYRRVL